MASTDLVFAAAPLTNGNLVFGDDGSNPISDALISGAIVLQRPSLQGKVVLGIVATGTITLARPTLTGEVKYVTDTQRPFVATAKVRWQDAEPQPEDAQSRWQDTTAQPTHARTHYEAADPLSTVIRNHWADADRQQRQALRTRFQDGVGVQVGARLRFQEAIRTPRSLRTRFENGIPVSRGVASRFQDGVKRPNVQHMRYQDALPLQVEAQSFNAYGLKLQRGWKTRYQDAIPPRPGRTILIPIPPYVEPCYTPSGELVFEAPWSADTNLVFICETHTPPQPGATVVVPVKKVYIVLNTASLHLVAGNVSIPTYAMSMSLDVDSWTWSFSASLPGAALGLVQPDGDGNPALVEAGINGEAFRFLVTGRGRDRAFASDGVRITGKGVAAELGDPIAPVMTFGNTIDRTAQQLMGDVLSLNGVALPWTVDWQMEDWLVTAGAWKKQGRYIDALNEIVAAAGGYLQPHPTAKTLHALLRYPVKPWDWAAVSPDYELPADVFTNETTEWGEKPVYDRVFVSGQGNGGRLVNVRREGTAGENEAPMVTDALITDVIAGRQRGTAILSDTGKINTYTLRGPAGLKDTDDNPVGIIVPGKFVRYVDPVEGTKIGITRSVNVNVQMPEIWQTITLETHEDV